MLPSLFPLTIHFRTHPNLPSPSFALLVVICVFEIFFFLSYPLTKPPLTLLPFSVPLTASLSPTFSDNFTDFLYSATCPVCYPPTHISVSVCCSDVRAWPPTLLTLQVRDHVPKVSSHDSCLLILSPVYNAMSKDGITLHEDYLLNVIVSCISDVTGAGVLIRLIYSILRAFYLSLHRTQWDILTLQDLQVSPLKTRKRGKIYKYKKSYISMKD